MSRINKIFGPPGTGKTTRLLNLVEREMASGMPPERIAYMAFTKKAATEAVERAKERFSFSEERLPWFRTLHSMAFHDLSVRRDDIMQTEHYQELGRSLGFQFTSLDEEMYIPMGTALGDRAARIEQLSRLRGVSLEDQWHDSNFNDVKWWVVQQWADGLKSYKEKRGLLDYTDLLEEFDATLDVDMFIIDEAQDLSPLQWKVVRKAAASSKIVYIAGDDDQCIYGWAGADVGRFLAIRANTEVLPLSFRLPRAIHGLAEGIVSGIEMRQQKVWKSRDDEGRIEWTKESALDLRTGSWLLLSRNHKFLRRFDDILRIGGFPFVRDGISSNDNRSVRAILAWERWRKGNLLKPAELTLLGEFVPELERWQPREAVFFHDAPLSKERRRQNWMDALLIEPVQREYVRSCLANGESLINQPRITVSTIHKVKGGEADNVALITDLSHKPWTQLAEDEEKRVLYVAVTRARQSLYILQPQTGRHYRI
jgi:DNA helicase-2/ATP-dependent DNA helicase PcrA